ncbi:MAG: glycine cleavage system protein GcvH [FCB group bacterium]|nr:glycine cleavage system protein GcvH [FCB group bacterium]
MNIPSELLYTKDHEWARFEGSEVTIGITDFAQGELGDIIYVEFPEIGQEVGKGDPIGTIEAVKTVADIYAPVAGKVTAVNNDLEDAPEQVNNDPYGAGWMIKLEVTDPSDKEGLLSADDYQALIN